MAQVYQLSHTASEIDRILTDAKTVNSRIRTLDGNFAPEYENGDISVNTDKTLKYANNTLQIRTKNSVTYKVPAGTSFKLSDYTNDVKLVVYYSYDGVNYSSFVCKEEAPLFVVEKDASVALKILGNTIKNDTSLSDRIVVDVLTVSERCDNICKDIDERLHPIDGGFAPEFESGNMGVSNNELTYSANTWRIRTREGVTHKVPAGTSFALSTYFRPSKPTEALKLYVYYSYDEAETYSYFVCKTGQPIFIAQQDAIVALKIEAGSTQSDTALADLLVVDIPSMAKRINAHISESEKSDFGWTLGGIKANGWASDGKAETASNRIRTGFIPVTGYGSTVIFDGAGSFMVFEYASNNEVGNLIKRTADNWITGKYAIEKAECRFIRIVAKKTDDADFTDADITALGSHFKFTQSHFTHRAVGRYVSPVKEDFHFSGDLEGYSQTNKLETLYAKWEELRGQYPNIITKTVLGEVGGKEIRHYRITPTPLRDAYRISRYSCEPLKILYVSSIHGGERSISVDDFAMFKNLVVNHEPRILWDNCVFEIIPVANPVGYDSHTRNNGNNVNINRNFPAGWVYNTDQYDASGESAGDQYETQVLMRFVKDNPDAFLVINRHGTADWRVGGLAGYAASAYQSDIETIIASGMATDTMLRGMDAYGNLINTMNPDTRIYTASHGDAFPGSFDMWFNSIGYHGYLLEFCDRFETGNVDGSTKDLEGFTETNNLNNTNGTIRRINISAIANLLCDSVLNNRGILGNNNKLPGKEVTP